MASRLTGIGEAEDNMCVRIDSVVQSGGRLELVGGPSGWGDGRWLLPVKDVVALIEEPTQQWDFFVEEPVGDRVSVVTRTSGGTTYLTTVPDGVPNAQNNLANLPQPPGGGEQKPPQNAAWLPGPRMPRMDQFGRFKNTPGPSGAYYALPTTAVSFRLVAPWPGDLRFTVRRLMDGQPNLEVPLPARRPDPPWVDHTPLEPGFVKRDLSLWWAQVALPAPALGVWVQAETFEIEVRHESFNPYCPAPRLSDPLRILLGPRRVGHNTVTVGSGGGGAGPTTGVITVPFVGVGEGRPGHPTSFTADTRQVAGVPAGAVITSTVNASQTAPQAAGAVRARQPLGGLRYSLTDVTGAARGMSGSADAQLGAGAATSMFNGLQVRGTWTADYVGGSVAFLYEGAGASTPRLNPVIALRVSWAVA
ncbi:DUF3892 domain-containing protein [Nocardioides euryhalodurans]|uniref:Uncharacterized protein n=1 Tax=Nocardioides euryhalodurans TaxID=2518370 RepID=A0A4P7GKU8_9ACTN|nr:DUF3892 domain-containing protein [Nocardioides euryhalodurans]QBR92718.1 hypothetical protein EXE57_10850 [Nocardioides euryhalodurans]